jgi:hypothetical protein
VLPQAEVKRHAITSTTFGIPEHFTLILRGDGRRVPWRKDKRIGVAFK